MEIMKFVLFCLVVTAGANLLEEIGESVQGLRDKRRRRLEDLRRVAYEAALAKEEEEEARQ